MSRKPKRGYFVRGQFVAEGSELDQQLKAELKGGPTSKSDLKRESERLQRLGESLLSLRDDLFQRLQLPQNLVDALAQVRRISNFEGRRRQMQYIGKLMRGLDEETIEAAQRALDEQHQASARETLALHEAERWRDELIARDEAMGEWLTRHPQTDAQQLRALVRQARKDRPSPDDIAKGLSSRQGRAYREIFQLLRQHLDSDLPDEATREPEE